MKTITDLRIRYKLSTGKYPLYTRSSLNSKIVYTFIEGTPRNEYGYWLEDLFSTYKIKSLRDNFHKQTALTPTTKYYDTRVKYEYFNKEYILWLEEYILKYQNETFIKLQF